MAKGILENVAKDIVIEGCETKLRQVGKLRCI
jgi:hypothetical protein